MTHRLDVGHESHEWTTAEWILFTSPFGTGHLFEKQITGSYGFKNLKDVEYLGLVVAQDVAYATVGRAAWGAGAMHRAKSLARLGVGRAAFAAGPVGILGGFFVFEALSNWKRPTRTVTTVDVGMGQSYEQVTYS